MTDTHDGNLTLDQNLALKVAAERLHREFADTFGTETIELFLHSSYDQFASRAAIPDVSAVAG